MKIMFLSSASSIHTVRWVNALAEKELEIYLVYIKGHAPKEKIDKRVKLYQLPFGGNKGYYFNSILLKKLYKKVSPDVINVHYASGYGTLARISKIHPLLLNVWGSDVYAFPYQSKFNLKVIQKNLKNADFLASTSYCMADQVRNIIEDSNQQIFITPFGVDLSKFDPSLYPQKSSEKIIIGNIKTLEPNYGIEDLIDAANILIKKLKTSNHQELLEKIEVHIYGDGSQKVELEKKIINLGLEKKIYLKGKIEHSKVPEILSQFSIFCCTSHHESFGVSIVEAISMRIPIIATKVDGFLEILKEDYGFLVPIRRPDIIAERLNDLLIHPKIYDECKKKINNIELKDYNFNNNILKMIEYYNEVLVKNDRYSDIKL